MSFYREAAKASEKLSLSHNFLLPFSKNSDFRKLLEFNMADALKAEGNKAFAAKNFQEAM